MKVLELNFGCSSLLIFWAFLAEWVSKDRGLFGGVFAGVFSPMTEFGEALAGFP
jgi:hypothetical protein